MSNRSLKKKFWKASKAFKIKWSASFEVNKICNLTSKGFANEIE